MASFNKVILMGNVTRDIETRYTGSGTAVCDLRVAVNRKYKAKSTGQMEEETTFVDITLWGRTAEIAGEYLKKGSAALIEGRLTLDQWNDKQTGEKRSKLKVSGENLTLLPKGGGGGRGEGSQAQPQWAAGEENQEVPF